MHDSLGALALFAFVRIEFDLPSVAALLTVVGYSINNTIVIYDRVREILPTQTKEPLTDKEVEGYVNEAVNNTLSRTINTTITTLCASVALLLLTKGAVQNFAAVLSLGILLGAFSSTFIAPATYLGLRKRFFDPEGAKKQTVKDIHAKIKSVVSFDIRYLKRLTKDSHRAVLFFCPNAPSSHRFSRFSNRFYRLCSFHKVIINGVYIMIFRYSTFSCLFILTALTGCPTHKEEADTPTSSHLPFARSTPVTKHLPRRKELGATRSTYCYQWWRIGCTLSCAIGSPRRYDPRESRFQSRRRYTETKRDRCHWRLRPCG